MFYSPLEQFDINILLSLDLFFFSINITNSALFMGLATLVLFLYTNASLNNVSVVPHRWQSTFEMVYEFIYNLVVENIGKEGKKYLPLIFTLFMFLILNNLLGMIPYSFTPTSHVSITFSLSLAFFIGVTLLGIYKHRILFLNNFFPSGTPYELSPLLVAIEVISYVSKAFSLAIRLFANMMSGHTLLKIIASFAWTMLSNGGFLCILGILPFLLLFVLTGLEIGIAILQAYVFTILVCIYINDSIHLH